MNLVGYDNNVIFYVNEQNKQKRIKLTQTVIKKQQKLSTDPLNNSVL